TQWCSQGDGDGTASIAFPHIGDADRFAQLVFDLGRPVAQQERGEAVIEPPPIGDWMFAFQLRMPLTQRAEITLQIPRKELQRLEEWLRGEPSGPLRHHAVFAPKPVVAEAGQPSSAEAEASHYEYADALDILEQLDNGTCPCERVDHEPDCPR